MTKVRRILEKLGRSIASAEEARDILVPKGSDFAVFRTVTDLGIPAHWPCKGGLLISRRALSKFGCLVIFPAEAGTKKRSNSLGYERQRGIMGTRLGGKVAIITGASRGQGAATAKLFGRGGSLLARDREH